MMDLGDALDGIKFAGSTSGSQCTPIINSKSLPPFNTTQQPPLDSLYVSAPSSTASGKWKMINDDKSTLALITHPPHSMKSGDLGKSACCYSHPTLLSQNAPLPFHYFSISLYSVDTYFLFTLLHPHVLLSLTRSDYASHEPSFLVLLPLVCAHFLYLFKIIVTACISLT
jgi:hypothetical protein